MLGSRSRALLGQKRDLMLSLITKATLVFKDVVVDCVNDDYDASGP